MTLIITDIELELMIESIDLSSVRSLYLSLICLGIVNRVLYNSI